MTDVYVVYVESLSVLSGLVGVYGSIRSAIRGAEEHVRKTNELLGCHVQWLWEIDESVNSPYAFIKPGGHRTIGWVHSGPSSKLCSLELWRTTVAEAPLEALAEAADE